VCISHLSHTCYMSHAPHHPWFVHPNNIWWSVQVMKLHIMQSSPVFCHSPLLRSKCPNILLSTLFSNTLNLCSSLVWETKFHTHTKHFPAFKLFYVKHIKVLL
jgi:hypothetical protein